MTTAKAVIVGLILTVGLLASTLAIEGVAQLLGPEEEEVHEDEVHLDEDEVHVDEDEDEDEEHDEEG